MDQPRGVRGREPAPGADERIRDLAGPAHAAQPGGERHSIDVLHREEDLAGVDTDIVDADDVWMREARHRLGFAQQPVLARFAAALGAQDLERDLAIELGVIGFVDHAQRTRAQHAPDLVAPHHGADR